MRLSELLSVDEMCSHQCNTLQSLLGIFEMCGNLKPKDGEKGSAGHRFFDLNLTSEAEVIRAIGRRLVPITIENHSAMVKVDARHLKAVATNGANSVTVQDAVDEAPKPDT